MKLITTIILLCSFIYVSNGQVAISARYLSNSSEAFEAPIQAGSVFNSGYELGIGYWFRLKNKRMEFTPEVSYATLNGDLFNNSSIGFNANILIYPLDFHSDCDACPTFSKDGGLVKKGFYWIISPGVWRFSTDNAALSIDKRSVLTYRVGAGAGLDIGVTNLLTISPFAMYNIVGSALYMDNQTATSLNQIHIGLRATLRFDKNKW